MKKLLLMALFLCPPLHAIVSLDINIINQKGIDKDFTLTSELHSIEDQLLEGQTYMLSMKNDLKLIYSIRFIEDPQTYGPGATLLVSGKVVNKKKQTLTILNKENMSIKIGKKRTIIYDKSDQRLEITIRPYIY